MVCLDRDRGAICCCFRGVRLPRGLAAGAGMGGSEERTAERSEEPRACPRGGICSRRQLPGCRGRWTLMLKLVRAVGARPPPSPEPGAGVPRQPAWGWGPRHELPVAVLLDWACKELKNIYMCGFFGRGSESLLVFHPLRSLGITQHTVKDNICAEPCVCV